MALTLKLTVQGITDNARSSLMSVSKFVQRNPDATELEQHNEMAELARNSRGTRSLLLLDSKARLIAESFREHVSRDTNGQPKLSLAKRQYAKRALRETKDRLIIEKIVVGKTSGLRFIPMAKAVYNLSGQLTNVAVAIIDPIIERSELKICQFCLFTVAAYDTGNVVETAPAGTKVPISFYTPILQNRANSGTTTGPFHEQQALTAWYKLPEYGLVVTATLFRPAS